MTALPLAYAFGAGLLATLNPCGFALLPSLIAFYLGLHEARPATLPFGRRLASAVGVGGLVTAGFLTVFVGGGLFASLGLRLVFAWVPYLTLGIGLVLTGVGVALVLGRSLTVPLPHPAWVVRRRGALPMYLYGVSYAVASLSCTLPVFLVVVGSAAAVATPGAGLLVFGAYSLGMAVVLLGVTVSAGLFEGVVARWLRPLVPYVQQTSGLLLILVGLYLAGYQLYAVWILGGAP